MIALGSLNEKYYPKANTAINLPISFFPKVEYQDSSHPVSARCHLPKFMREVKADRDKILGYYGTKICALGILKVSAPNFLKKAYRISNAL